MQPPQKTQRGIEKEHGRFLLREMLRIRRFEEKAAELYSLMKIRGFLHLYIGEEAVAVGVMQALREGDAVVATYREHGQALARGIKAGALMAEMYGKANGTSRGHGGSMHIFDAQKRFYGGHAIVAGGLPVAVGLGLADKYLSRDRLTACFFGDGAVAEGEFHESMNLASLWSLPILFLCENNLYAMGTALNRHQAQTNIAHKAASYSVGAEAVDGMDVLAVEEASWRATQWVRQQSKPYLLELKTYRFRAHSMADPDLYRSKEELERFKALDPITTFAAQLKDKLLSEPEFLAIEAEVQAEIAEAVTFAEAGSFEPREDLLKDVYTVQR